MHPLLQKAKLKLKWGFNDLGHALGWSPKMKESFRRCIVYHGVDHRGEKKLNSRFISLTKLDNHFAWLAQYCEVVTTQEYFERPQAGEKPLICLTFDDGYLNNLELMLPLLEKYNFPATIYLCGINFAGSPLLWTDQLDLVAATSKPTLTLEGQAYTPDRKGEYRNAQGRSLKTVAKTWNADQLLQLQATLEPHSQFREAQEYDLYWKIMTSDDLQAHAKHPLLDFGLHGYSHASLGELPHSEAIEELKRGKSILENLLQRPLQSLAYPSCSYTPELIQAAASLGLPYQWVCDYFSKTDRKDPRIENRFIVNPHISWHNQKLALQKGSYL